MFTVVDEDVPSLDHGPGRDLILHHDREVHVKDVVDLAPEAGTAIVN